jgi:hypothetical protein
MSQSDPSITRLLASVLVFIIFVAVSVWTYTTLVSSGYGDWWQWIIPIAIEWLVFLVVAKFLLTEDFD